MFQHMLFLISYSCEQRVAETYTPETRPLYVCPNSGNRWHQGEYHKGCVSLQALIAMVGKEEREITTKTACLLNNQKAVGGSGVGSGRSIVVQRKQVLVRGTSLQNMANSPS